MPVVTAVEVQKRSKERVNIYLDGSYAFSLNIVDAASLRTGQSLSDSEIAAMRGEDAVVRAVDSAARFLGHRPRSVSKYAGISKTRSSTPALSTPRSNALSEWDTSTIRRSRSIGSRTVSSSSRSAHLPCALNYARKGSATP